MVVVVVVESHSLFWSFRRSRNNVFNVNSLHFRRGEEIYMCHYLGGFSSACAVQDDQTGTSSGAAVETLHLRWRVIRAMKAANWSPLTSEATGCFAGRSRSHWLHSIVNARQLANNGSLIFHPQIGAAAAAKKGNAFYSEPPETTTTRRRSWQRSKRLACFLPTFV